MTGFIERHIAAGGKVEDGAPDEVRKLRALVAELAGALQSTRLMLYAWKAARAKFGLVDDHDELNGALSEVEVALAKAKEGE